MVYDMLQYYEVVLHDNICYFVNPKTKSLYWFFLLHVTFIDTIYTLIKTDISVRNEAMESSEFILELLLGFACYIDVAFFSGHWRALHLSFLWPFSPCAP